CVISDNLGMLLNRSHAATRPLYQEGAHADRGGPDDIFLERVSDVQDVLRRQAEVSDCSLEDRGSRFVSLLLLGRDEKAEAEAVVVQGLEEQHRVHVRDDRQGDLLLELMQDGPDLRVGPDAKVFVESVIDAGVQVPGQPELPEHFSEGVSMEVAERDERIGGKLLLHRPSPSLRGPPVDGTASLAKGSFDDQWDAML